MISYEEIREKFKELKLYKEALTECNKQDTPRYIELKRQYRQLLREYVEECEEPSEYVYYPYNDGECYIVVCEYPREESETKEEFVEWFWETQALRIYEDYSPTGKWFTASFRCAKSHTKDGKLSWHCHHTITLDC